MQAVVAPTLGPTHTFRLTNRDPHEPARHEIRVAVHAAGVSYVDVLVAEGRYQVQPEAPFVPGSEFAGTVEALGSEVTEFDVGDRVAATAFGGAFAELATIPAEAAWRIPDAMSFSEAAVFLVSYATAYHALCDRGRLVSGDRLLVLGAGGAVGFAAVQIGRALGAEVIASASSQAKRELALRGGAEVALDSGAEDWRGLLERACNGRGPDLILDPVGGAFSERALRTITWNGRHLLVGFAAGTIPRIPVNLILLKGAELVGVDIRQFMLQEPEHAAANRLVLRQLYEAGTLAPCIARRYPLEDFVSAMEDARSGTLAGRVVLEIRQEGGPTP